MFSDCFLIVSFDRHLTERQANSSLGRTPNRLTHFIRLENCLPQIWLHADISAYGSNAYFGTTFGNIFSDTTCSAIEIALSDRLFDILSNFIYDAIGIIISDTANDIAGGLPSSPEKE